MRNSKRGTRDKQIRDMFASIAPRYDLLNSVLSFNLHRYWRRFAVAKCELSPGDSALDVGTGTGDLAIELARTVGERGCVVGLDFCGPMLDLAARKISRIGITNTTLLEGNAEKLPLHSDSYQAAVAGFAIRNVESIEAALAEMTRIVVPGGRVVILELATPRGSLFRIAHGLYSNHLLPLIGWAVNRKRGPYDYLPASVASFLSREELKSLMVKVGLTDVRVYDLTGGAVAVHAGTKR